MPDGELLENAPLALEQSALRKDRRLLPMLIRGGIIALGASFYGCTIFATLFALFGFGSFGSMYLQAMQCCGECCAPAAALALVCAIAQEGVRFARFLRTKHTAAELRGGSLLSPQS